MSARLRSSLSILLALIAIPALAQGHGGGGGGHGGGGGTRTGGTTTSSSTVPASPYATNAAIPTTISPQLASDEGKLEFRTETILVQVPVVVTGKNGGHVRGLTKDDFHLLENGKQQSISTFEEVVASNSRLSPPASMPGEFRNLTLPDKEPHAVTVIALDTVNTPFLDQTFGRHELVKYLAKNLDVSQALALMIITSHGLKIVQGLTGDPAQLLQAVKKVSGELPGDVGISLDAQADAATGNIPAVSMISPGSDPTSAMESFVEHGDALYAQFYQASAIETTLNAFRAIAWSLSGIPGRKSLLWATGSFPFVISSPDVVPGGYLSPLYERTMQELNAAQISVYPIDVRGLVDAIGMGDASQLSAPTPQRMSNRVWLQQSKIDSLNEFADMTGGKAFYNTNDLATSFKRAAEDGSSYYLLGYYLDTKNNHAGWRQLKVKVDKKDIEVRARKGFFVTNATIRAEMTRNTDINYALNSPLEGTGVPLTVKWLGVSGSADKKTAQLLIHLPPDSVSLVGRDQNQLNFDFALAAYSDKSKDGKPVLTRGKVINPTITPEKLATLRKDGVGFTDSMELAPGQYNIRVVIRDNVTGKIGSVTAPLTVN
jgi:VWFA-related protein